jgi:hypothetical protein
MGYNVSIKARAEREALIAKSVSATTAAPYPFHEFRNKRHDLPVILVPIDLPVYRMQNFRTFSDQAEFLTKENVAPDYFQSGQEVETVQQVQHDMLAKLSERSVSDSVASIIDVLKRDKQREPLLITSTGVVVNGNRRLAAMRELFADPSKEFSNFSHIDCAVLPSDATLAEVLDIEAGLQAKTETKLDYDWVGDAQLMKAMIQSHGGIPDVARRTNRGEKEIQNTIRALAEADIYLKEWVESPGKYSLVRENGRQIFKDLPKQLENKEVGLQQASRAIAWTLFENRDRLSERVYNYNSAIGKLAADVMDRVIEKLGIPIGEPADEDNADFDVDFGEDAEVTDYTAVIEQLRDPSTKTEAIDALIDAAQTAIEVENGQKSGQASLKAIGQAHAKLMAVDFTRAAPDTHQAMLKQLQGIEQLTSALIAKIKNYKVES